MSDDGDAQGHSNSQRTSVVQGSQWIWTEQFWLDVYHTRPETGEEMVREIREMMGQDVG